MQEKVSFVSNVIMFYVVLNVWLGLGSCTFIEETLNCWTLLISHLKWVCTYTHLPVYKALMFNYLLGPFFFTIAKVNIRPAVTISVSYDLGSCPLT